MHSPEPEPEPELNDAAAFDFAGLLEQPRRIAALQGVALLCSIDAWKVVSQGKKLQRRVLALTDDSLLDLQVSSLKCVHRVEIASLDGCSISPVATARAGAPAGEGSPVETGESMIIYVDSSRDKKAKDFMFTSVNSHALFQRVHATYERKFHRPLRRRDWHAEGGPETNLLSLVAANAAAVHSTVTPAAAGGEVSPGTGHEDSLFSGGNGDDDSGRDGETKKTNWRKGRIGMKALRNITRVTGGESGDDTVSTAAAAATTAVDAVQEPSRTMRRTLSMDAGDRQQQDSDSPDKDKKPRSIQGFSSIIEKGLDKGLRETENFLKTKGDALSRVAAEQQGHMSRLAADTYKSVADSADKAAKEAMDAALTGVKDLVSGPTERKEHMEDGSVVIRKIPKRHKPSKKGKGDAEHEMRQMGAKLAEMGITVPDEASFDEIQALDEVISLVDTYVLRTAAEAGVLSYDLMSRHVSLGTSSSPQGLRQLPSDTAIDIQDELMVAMRGATTRTPPL